MATPAYRFVKAEKFVVGDGEPVTTKAAITAPAAGVTIDAESRAAINAIITALEAFGIVEVN